ncbi:unnamed protein product [Prorocentrum cordatum]|uniref:Uncharacterized protein n=1 Tax=Prorocentrum cordatum TaxID=2364126 RepID=A0ABN9XJI3_9DINO|nr:unnamed protein product [Polarella glacialis]
MVNHGKQGFSTCAQCGNWAWNWRLKKQKGVCAVCNTPQPGWCTTTSGTLWAPWSSGGGWHDHGQSLPSLANLGDYLSKALAGAGLDGDPDAARLATEFSTLASQKLAAAPAPPPKPQHALLKEATADCSRRQEALEKAAKKLEQSRLQLEKDQAKFDEAVQEVQEAANPPEAATKQSGFVLDPGLFECLDELEESDRQVTQLVDAKQKEFQDLLERTRSAHTAAAAKRRKRGADGEAVAGGGAEGSPAAGSGAAAALGAAAAAAGPSKAKVVVQESDQKAMLERIKSSAQAQARAAADGKAAGAGKGGNAGAGKGVAAAGAGAGEKDMPDICQAIDKDGWRMAYTAARPSGKSEEQRQRRMQALPIEFQEGFDELEPPAPPPAPTVSFAIPEETWFEAQTQVYWEGLPQLFEDQPEGARGKVAAFDRSQHFVFEWQPEERARLDESYGAWISTLERATLIHEQVDASTWMQFSAHFLGGHHAQWADLSTSRALLASRSSFVKWVKESWSSKPGAVHRHVKQAPPLEWGGRDAAGAITTDKQTMLQTSASEWNAMWRDPVDQPADILYMMGQCLSAARDDPLPAITIMDVDAVLPTLPAKKAKGVDVLNPIDIQRQPLVARQCLVDILNNIEQAGAWPSPLSSVLGAAIPKGAGGNRVLGLVPTPHKVWSKVVKWKDVRGPIAAVQATLLQIGWDPQSPDVWSRPLPDGTIDDWLFPAFGDEQFATAVPSHFEDMLGAFMDDCAQLQWKEAAHHEAGEDLAAGADMTTVQIELNRLAAKSKFDEWAADIAVISGGQWTRERQIAAGAPRNLVQGITREGEEYYDRTLKDYKGLSWDDITPENAARMTRVKNLDQEEFKELVRRAYPFVVEDCVPEDAELKEFACSEYGKRWPKEHMRAEYTPGQKHINVGGPTP